MTPDTPSNPEAAVLVAITRLEGKLDTALAQHGTRLEETARMASDHETRIRAIEAEPTVSPRQLWATVSSVVLTVAAISPFLVRFFATT